eukprot:CAMPEP_0197632060 /NCGR_PEP_ID=MMETSP1338-20131121/8991_1 /TAXON_ID=43686 ORGANISM="Pelagodinium beii, Strain RCC1491" /NCGR_SAMPLE_ID=MMETSP1338 /ASSEMBLY_ACC=CAM_ASM_000754 /LENGTH=619 /DNA_ID=CAMNT_0043203609 /DNA_START=6 /DNA_END=1865 /DNA_ORIENTATION=-
MAPHSRPATAGFGRAGTQHMQAAQMQLHQATTALKEDINQLVRKHQSEVDDAFSQWVARTTLLASGSANAPVELCIKCWAADRGKRDMQMVQSPDVHVLEDLNTSNASNFKATVYSRPMTAQRPTRPASAATAYSSPAAPGKNLPMRPATAEIPGLVDVEDVEDSPEAIPSEEETEFQESSKEKANDPPKLKRRSSIVGNEGMLPHEKTWLQNFAGSKAYEYASIALILTNSFFIGFQTQYMAERAHGEALQGQALSEDLPNAMKIISLIFNILFTWDLAIRWRAEGFWGFLQSEDLSWNLFDTVIVLAGLMDIAIYIFFAVAGDDTSPSVASVARVLRIMRIAKIARIVRVLKFFRELRMMVFSIIASMVSLIWVMLILGLVFYVFGIIFTNGVLTTLVTPDMWIDEDNAGLIETFGTLGNSIITLFMAMTGGNDWGEYYFNLGQVSGFHQTCFLLFIVFALFAVVNIVTGVFVDSAMQASTMDQSMVIAEEMARKKHQLANLRSAFEDLDIEGDGVFDLEEFEERLHDERVEAYFQSMKLDVKDAKTIFRLLDSDNSNSISIDEFVDGIWGLLGEASNLDSKIMQFEIKYVKEQISAVREALRTNNSGSKPMNTRSQ